MTWRYFKTFTFCAFFFIPLFSCDKQKDVQDCLSFTKAPITKIEGGNDALVNQEVGLTVSFGCFNGCGQFGNFEQTSNGDTTTINVIAKYEGCLCTQDVPLRQATYKFKVTQTGTYYLKFLQTGKTYLTDTIRVQ